MIGAVQEVLVASFDRAAIVARLSSPHCHVVTFTVTEKGYCRTTDGSLDIGLAQDGFYPLLSEALTLRRANDLPGVTLLSCDNLSGNGRQLGRLMRAWLAAEAPFLSEWFDANCTTPDSMVDRIVPASTQNDLAQLEKNSGLRDEGAVFTEPFSQWVIEDRFAGPRPKWEAHGAQIVADVAPFETAKLRMLNGAHSLLAYAGLDAGHTFVHEAVGDPHLRTLVLSLMLEDAAPTIETGEGQDLAAYAAALMERFDNPALKHRLFQIAMDGSQKVPQRWLETLMIQQERGQQCPAILCGLGHWLRHVRGDLREVEDPLVQQMQDLWQRVGASGIVSAMFGDGGLLGSAWRPTQSDRELIEQTIRSAGDQA